MDDKSLPKKMKLYSAFWLQISRNHFNCSMVLAAPLQHGAESTRAFGPLPSAAETTISHQWWPDCHWYRSVSYTSTGRWPLVTIDTNSHRCWLSLGKVRIPTLKLFLNLQSFGSGFWFRLCPCGLGKYKCPNTATYQTSSTFRGRNSNLPRGTRGKINRCVIFWRQFFY